MTNHINNDLFERLINIRLYLENADKVIKEHLSTAELRRSEFNQKQKHQMTELLKKIDNDKKYFNNKYNEKVKPYQDKINKFNKMYSLLSQKNKKFSIFYSEHANMLSSDFIGIIKENYTKLSLEELEVLIHKVFNKLDASTNSIFSFKFKSNCRLFIYCYKKIIEENEKEINSLKESLLNQAELAVEEINRNIERLKHTHNLDINRVNKETQEDYIFIINQINEKLSEYFPEKLLDDLQGIIQLNSSFTGLTHTLNKEIYFGEVAFDFNPLIEHDFYFEYFDLFKHKAFQDGIITLPFLLPINKGQIFSCSCEDTTNGYDREFITSSLYNYIRYLPVNNLELVIIDPEKKGQSIKELLDLYSRYPLLFSNKIYTSRDDIQNKIKEINNHLEDIIQRKLVNKYDNVYEYNKANPNNMVKFIVIAIFDFPKFLEHGTLEYLYDLIKNANKCNISFFIQYNNSDINNYDYLRESNILKRIVDSGFKLQINKDIIQIEEIEDAYLLANKPSKRLVDTINESYTKAATEANSKSLLFKDIINLEDIFTGKAEKVFSIPIGEADDSKIHYLEIGKETSQHVLIAGATGGGKSTLLHTIIMSSLLHYSPDELNLYLLDFKSGTEFKIYENAYLPQIKVLALDAMQEFGESILQELIEEFNRRSIIFKKEGRKNITDIVPNMTKFPRILVVIDEFQILFYEKTNYKVASNCSALLTRLITEGRAYGINFILATQSIKNLRENCVIGQATLEQIRIRIGLACGEDDAISLFGDANVKSSMQKMVGPRGVAAYNSEFVKYESIGIRFAYCKPENQKILLEHVAHEGRKWAHEKTVFEGMRVETIRLNQIRNLQRGKDIQVYLGKPIKICENLKITFNKKRLSNLIIVGGNDSLCEKLTQLLIYGLIGYDDIKIYYGDGNFFTDTNISQSVIENIDNPSLQLMKEAKDFIEAIEEISKELKNRKRRKSDNQTRLFIFLNNLGAISIMKKVFQGDEINKKDYYYDDNEEEDFDYINYSDLFSEILKEGFQYDIHVVCVSNSFVSIKNEMRYGALSYFTNRVIFRLQESEASELIDRAEIDKLNELTAVYYDSISLQLLFKPFVIEKD